MRSRVCVRRWETPWSLLLEINCDWPGSEVLWTYVEPAGQGPPEPRKLRLSLEQQKTLQSPGQFFVRYYFLYAALLVLPFVMLSYYKLDRACKKTIFGTPPPLLPKAKRSQIFGEPSLVFPPPSSACFAFFDFFTGACRFPSFLLALRDEFSRGAQLCKRCVSHTVCGMRCGTGAHPLARTRPLFVGDGGISRKSP